ncbi:MAG TPA: hypothetical protein VG096_15260 [Bryobacteraceae bacterium]|nr:hypothetical protein [Bryobacteraceae bacterium]
MKGARTLAVALVLAAGFTWGILQLFRSQFAAGNFYPEYSSLRTDAKGAKLLFDSLSRVPGLNVTRNYLPLDYFPGKAALLLLGLNPEALDHEFLQHAEALARRGNRVVVALSYQASSQGEEQAGGKAKDKSPLEEVWHVQLVVDPKEPRHPLSLAAPSEWAVRDSLGSRVIAIERAFDAGNVLLVAESGDFSNESTIAADHLDRVSTAIGSQVRVAFDEAHFGIAESGSVVGLVRRFRLVGLTLGLVIVGALALLKNASAFPPPGAARGPAQYTGRTSFEGLVALLRRHVRAKDLVQTCWDEWLKANRRQVPPERASRAAAIVAGASRHPLEAMREIQAGLSWPPSGRAKGEL